MEFDNTTGIIHVPTGDWDMVDRLLKKFNDVYTNSNLKYLESVDIDGVMFSYIDAREATVDHIFLFGSMFGSKVRELRDNREIFW